MSLQTEIKSESGIALSLPTVLYRIRHDFEECIRDNASIDQTLEKICYDSSQVKGFILYFPNQDCEKSECLDVGILIVRYKDSWSYPICINVCYSSQFGSNIESQRKDKQMYLIIFKEQNIIDTFFQKEEINFANEISAESNQMCIFSLLRNRIELIDSFASFNSMIIKNAKQLNEEYYGSRFAFSVILSGKLEKSSMEDYDALLKIINEKFMPTQMISGNPANQSLQNQSGTKNSISEKLNDFKQSAGMQLNIAKEQLGNAIYNVKNRAGELVSNVQSKIGSESSGANPEITAVNPMQENIQDNTVEKGSERATTQDTGKKIKETITNLKDKASERAQGLKSNIENKFSKSNADQNKESSEKMERFSPQIEQNSYDATENMDSSIGNAPLYRNAENKQETDYTDRNLINDMREQQPLLMQEHQQGEKKSLGSKLNDLKESASYQLTTAKEQIGSTISSVKTKAEELVSNIQTKVHPSLDSEKAQRETEIELPTQGSKDLDQSSENKMNVQESSAHSGPEKLKEKFENIKEKASEKVQDLKSKIENKKESNMSENKDKVDLIDHNLRQTMRESEPLLQQEQPQQEETTSFGKEKLTETFENIKEKASEKAQEFKTKIEDRFSNEKKQDISSQGMEESHSSQMKPQNNQWSSSQKGKSFDTMPQSTSSDIRVGANETNAENDFIDHGLRQKMREGQPLMQQERPEQETASIGSKLNDMKQSAGNQLQSIKHQIASGIDNVKEKSYEKANEIKSAMQNLGGENQNTQQDTKASAMASNEANIDTAEQNDQNKVTSIEVEVKKYKIANLDQYKNKDSLNEGTEPK